MDEAARQRSAAGGFWAHSLQVYAQPGVEPACLRLQDEAGLDPNLLLLALYAGGIGRAIGVDDWQRLDALVAPLREQLIHRHGDRVGQQHFLRQPDDELLRSGAQIHRTHASRIQAAGNGGVAHDGAGDQLRE